MFIRVQSYEQQEGFLGYKYQEGYQIWINTDTILGFHKIDNMYILYSSLPCGKTFINEQDMDRIRSHLSLDE